MKTRAGRRCAGAAQLTKSCVLPWMEGGKPGRAEWRRSKKSNCAWSICVPKVKRTDAIQSFVSQETPIVTITDSDGAVGTGYSYTIGTGGSSVMRLLSDHLAPRVSARMPIASKRSGMISNFHPCHDDRRDHRNCAGSHRHGAVGPARQEARPALVETCGRRRDRCPLYTTEGGWLHIEKQALVDDALAGAGQGLHGSKVKIGRPHGSEDLARLSAVREAVGAGLRDHDRCQSGFSLDEAIRRAAPAARYRPGLDRGAAAGRRYRWPCAALRSTATPIAVGESLYSIRHFREYMQKGACSIVQVDVGRIGGITPWLKVAHVAESLQHPGMPAFSDGTACQPYLRGSERQICGIYSRSSTS